MREEDKVLLLAEIIGVDTSKYIEKYLDELRSSDLFMHLCNTVKQARNINSYKSQLLIDEFEAIDFSKIKSLKQIFVLYANINYLISRFEDDDMINPFFYNDDYDKIKKVGEISIFFDNKKFTLNDMILDERYTTIYKLDCIKEQYLLWRKELVEKIRNPLQYLVVKDKKVPKIKIIDDNFKFIILFVIMANICFLIAPIFSSNFIISLYNGNGNLIFQIMFYVMVILMFIIDIYIIILISVRCKKRLKYVRAIKVINNSHKIVNEMNKKCVNFYYYVLNGLEDNKLLNNEISKYSLNKKYVSSIAGIISLINYPNEKLSKQYIPFLLRLLLVMFFLLCFIFLVYLLYLIAR